MGEERVWAALSETNRRAVLAALVPGEMTVTGIAAEVGLTQPTTSKHLKVLRDAELVAVRVCGQHRWYSVDPAGLQLIDAWLAPYRQRWTTSLDRLGSHLDAQSNSPAPVQHQEKEIDHDRPT